jgi:signal transduction histidine kinase/DNA-binding response OmpR family regulator
MRILIVDDHDLVRRQVRSLLSDYPNFEVCGEAADGLDAIEKAKSLRPDLVLMDISMPRMNGLEATKVIRRELPSVDVIVLSQNDARVGREQALEAGAHNFVSKMSLLDDLIPEVETIAANRNETPPASKSAHEDNDESLFAGNSEMAGRMRAMDWSKTPLGPTDKWSQALRMMVRFMLPNPFPQLLWWGPELCCIYNDAYSPVLGTKHPWALGRPTTEVWREVWHVLGPLVDAPFHGGPATWAEDIPLEINRNGFMEETHFTISYSPVPDDTVASRIGGVMATVQEITQKVVGERRIVILKDLGARSTEPKSADEACMIAAQTLERHSLDVPFALFYLIDEKQEGVSFAAGTDSNHRPLSKYVAFADEQDKTGWPFEEVLKSEETVVVNELADRFTEVPKGPWSDPPSSAAVVPIRSNIPHRIAGFAAIGISSRLQFDESYRNFLDLVSTQISISVANARAYEEERKRAEALAEIDRAKTAFFSNVSHEFRTPLTLMLGPLEDLLSRSKTHLSPIAAEQLELVNRNGGRLLRLVNTLLDFSRIEAGRVRAVYEPTDLAAFTVELAAVFRSAVERAGLQLNVDCKPTKDVAYVDREMWEKIVLNLISNAFKFTLTGQISVALAQVGSSIELRVQDTGVGIPAEEIPQLFDRFHRVPNTLSRTHEGSGIGLALVNELVKLHGGVIRVDSTLDNGSSFTVSIPVGREHLPTDQVGGERTIASTAIGATPFVQEALRWLPGVDSRVAEEIPLDVELLAVPHAPAAIATKRPHVLLADDNADMRQYLTRLLSERYEVTGAPDGRAALEFARKQAPDLVLTDVMMPNLDGFGLLRELRSHSATKTVPILLLSARAGEEARVDGLDAGADDYLVKPFSARELLARVQTHLDLARVRKEANEAIVKNEERLRAFVAASSDVIYRMSPDWTQMYQLNGKDFISDTTQPNKNWLQEYILPEDSAEVMNGVNEAIRAKSVFQMEHRVRRAEGSIGWTFSRAVPLLDKDGEIVEWFGAASDITVRRNAAQDLQDAHENLEQRVRQRTEELESAHRDLRELSGQLLRLQDEERRRIASALHDSAGQTLTLLGMNLAAISQTAKKLNAQIASSAEEAEDLVSQVMQEIRTTSYLLHPPLLNERGIAAALRTYIEGLESRTKLKMKLTIADDFGRLPQEIELGMFRVVQESLTNVLRHSQSNDVDIRIRREKKSVLLEVQDHGVGIPKERLDALQRGGAGVGMRGMRHRVQLLGGQMKVASNDRGTTISVTIPVDSKPN